MISNNLVEHNGSLRYVFGRSSDQLRIEGQWVPENSVNNPSGKSGLLFNLLRALPNWPLVDGINMNKRSGGFVPDAHQFLPLGLVFVEAKAYFVVVFSLRMKVELERHSLLRLQYDMLV